MLTRIFVLLIFTLALPEMLFARIGESWTYQEMFEKADLVVIAYVLSTKDTDERTSILNDTNVIGVTTEFKTCLILKAAKKMATFGLHHFRYPSENDRIDIADGPNLIQIGPYNPVFLLFLVQEADGRFAPVTGQIDPASYSVLKLNGAALGDFEGPPPPRQDDKP